MRHVRALIVFFAFGILAALGMIVWSAGGPANASGNSIEAPDTAGLVGYYASMVLDASGHPVVSYLDDAGGNGGFKVLHCGNATCSSGNTIENPDNGTNAGFGSSIVLDSVGRPVVAYYDHGVGDLEFVHCGDASCSAGNTFNTVDSSAAQVGFGPSLILDSSGYPVISYYDATNQDLKVAHCGDANCSSKTINTPDSAGNIGGGIDGPTSITLDSGGNPVVSYYDASNSDLKVLHCGDSLCSSGNVMTSPDTAGSVGRMTSIALNASGNPVISYSDGTNADLKVLVCGDSSCSSGNTATTADTAGGWNSSLVLNGAGNPVVSFFTESSSYDLKVLICGNATCSSGNSTFTATDTGTTASIAANTSVALDASGSPVVAYHTFEGDDLRVLHCSDATCSGTKPTPTFTYTPTPTPTPIGATGVWFKTGSMGTLRAFDEAVLLDNGKVLVVGGESAPATYLTSAELFDPASGTFSSTGSMAIGRNQFTATKLLNGKVLVAGGCCPSQATAELYDPVAGTWSTTGSMGEARRGHTATLLANGKVLVTGSPGGTTTTAELYDPTSGTWSATGSVNVARYAATATRLADGKVLVAGGGVTPSTSAELYDPTSETWSTTGSLNAARASHTAALLADGRVLVIGGSGPSALASAEVYDPTSETWSTTGSMATARISPGTAALLDGTVLVEGGSSSCCSLNSAELYNPATGSWSAISSLNTARYSHTATRLANGRVLVAGGYNSQSSSYLATAQVYAPAVAPAAGGTTQVSPGFNHACALTSEGAVLCWGRNDNGQLGDGTTTEQHAPVAVSGLGSGVAAISASYRHTCALTTGGGVKCWGGNSAGQLGDGTTTDRLTPVDVTGLTSGVIAISAGTEHTCALTAAGGLKCWGTNAFGQLGNGTNTGPDCSGTCHPTPVNVTGLTSGVAGVAAGGDFTCAFTTGGAAKCWGYNVSGQLGNGSTSGPDCSGTCHSTAVNVTGLGSGVASMSSGIAHSCALITGGGVKCWGQNLWAAVGDGTTTDRSTPVDVTGLTSGVSAVSAGGQHTCALTTNGGVKCWGQNLSGQLGIGTTTGPQTCNLSPCSTTPVNVVGLGSGVARIDMSFGQSCAVISSNIKCWGKNDYGQIGDGTTTTRSTPVGVSGLSKNANMNTGCPIVPDLDFPEPGCDTVSVSGTFYTNITTPITASFTCPVHGTITFARFNNPFDPFYPDPNDPTVRGSNTEVLSAVGYGTCTSVSPPISFPITARNSTHPDRRTFGRFQEQVANTPGLFPVDSYSNYFFTVETPYGTFHNKVAVVSRCNNISAIPITGCTSFYDGPYGGGAGEAAGSIAGSPPPVPIYDDDDVQVGDSTWATLTVTAEDSDGDACPDSDEQGSMATQGGQRDEYNSWDYFNPSHDGLNRVDDILLVVQSYFVDSGNLNYNPGRDRTYIGPNAWNLGPPNGLQRVDDILNIVKQYFHDCS